MPRIRLAERAPGPQGNNNDRLKSARSLPPLFQNLSRVFFLGAIPPKEPSTPIPSTGLKETQHQVPTLTRKQSSGVASESLVPEYTNIPIPIPDTGVHPTLVPGSFPDVYFPGSTLTIHDGSMTTAGSASVSYHSSVTATAVPAPPSSTSSPLSAVHFPKPQRTLSNTAIASLCIGAGCLVFFVFALIKVCTRPRRRPRLTPSLPILDNEYLGDVEPKESPIFGGKERLSSKMDSDDAWLNSSHALPSLTLLQPAKFSACATANRANEQDISSHSHSQEKPSAPTSMSACGLQCLRATRDDTSSPRQRPSSVYQPPYQQVQDAITQTMKRLSSVSLSLYPGSPNHGVGIALGGNETPLTGDGYFCKARLRAKNLKAKEHRGRQSHGLAYDDLVQGSPSIAGYEHTAITPQSLAQGGRTRIKSSYYAPGIHSRISIPSTFDPRMNDSIKETCPKSDIRQDKDSHSLTRALGLLSPPGLQAFSPDTTMFPDDSSSVADNKDTKEPFTPDLGATLGTLLISEGQSEISKSGTGFSDDTGPRPFGDIASLRIGGSGKKLTQPCRTLDKPPRVPSPPPLPSLAQMAMEHHNKIDFESYRSPTYSIYGFYGGSGGACH